MPIWTIESLQNNYTQDLKMASSVSINFSESKVSIERNPPPAYQSDMNVIIAKIIIVSAAVFAILVSCAIFNPGFALLSGVAIVVLTAYLLKTLDRTGCFSGVLIDM